MNKYTNNRMNFRDLEIRDHVSRNNKPKNDIGNELKDNGK